MTTVQVVLAEDHVSTKRRKVAVCEVYEDEPTAARRMNDLIAEGFDRVVRIPTPLRTEVYVGV